MQSKKIWSANLEAHGAATVDLERLFLPQIYKFCHNKQPIQVLLHSSFGPFRELEGMVFFEFLKALFPQTSFAVVDQIPIAAPYNIGYLGQNNQAARILGAEDHLKIMNGLLSIFKEVGTNVFIVGLGNAGRYSATLPDILDDSAVHPCNVYGSCFGMNQTWNSNFSYAQLYTKLYVGDLTKAQGRIAVKVLQLQGERLAYTKRPTNVAMIEKQQNAWNSVEPIINKLRALHQTNPTIRKLCSAYTDTECRNYRCNNRLANGSETKYCVTCVAKCRNYGCNNPLATGSEKKLWANGSEKKLCSTCAANCRNYGCEKAFVDSVLKLCSTCAAKCHTHGCTNVLADDDPTLCSDCRLKQQLKGELAKPGIKKRSIQMWWPKTEEETKARRFDWGKCRKCPMMGSFNDPKDPSRRHKHANCGGYFGDYRRKLKSGGDRYRQRKKKFDNEK